MLKPHVNFAAGRTEMTCAGREVHRSASCGQGIFMSISQLFVLAALCFLISGRNRRLSASLSSCDWSLSRFSFSSLFWLFSAFFFVLAAFLFGISSFLSCPTTDNSEDAWPAEMEHRIFGRASQHGRE